MSTASHNPLLVAAFYAFTPLTEATRDRLLEGLPGLAEAGDVRDRCWSPLKG